MVPYQLPPLFRVLAALVLLCGAITGEAIPYSQDVGINSNYVVTTLYHSVQCITTCALLKFKVEQSKKVCCFGWLASVLARESEQASHCRQICHSQLSTWTVCMASNISEEYP